MSKLGIFRFCGAGFAVAALLGAGVAIAEDGHDHGHGDHVEVGAHEHGHGTLDIVVEGGLVLAELQVPSFDIVGFEHAAMSKAEKEAASSAREVLAKPLALLGPSADAKCALTSMSVEFGGEKAGAAAKADRVDGHSHDDHAHRDGHHADHADHDDQAESGHSEVRASYTLNCAAAGELESLALTYFDTFSNARVLTVNVVSPNGQFSQEASRAQPVIRISRGGS